MKTSSRYFLALSILLVSSCFLFSCSETRDEPVKIAVSKLYPNYENWLVQSDSMLVISNFYPMGVDSALMMLDDHHALLVTGGEDVFPDWYGMIHDTARCGAFDRYRDTLEIMLIRKALEMNIPILGICRGHQILNVTLGGTLIIDIPDDIGDEVIHRCPDEPLACHHSVMVFEGSLLHEITGQAYGMVNTNHHQAVNDLAPGLRISAVSAEGLAEAIEYEDFTIRPYLLGVQWHPERMEDYPDLSTPIAKRFIQETKKYARRR
jgi:putative glutamine amidotransferase